MFNYYVKLEGRTQGRIVASGEGRVHGMGYGEKKITPATLGHTLFQIKTELGVSNGSLIGKRQHKPFTITKEVGSSSPLLWQALSTNETLQAIDISLVRRPSSGTGEQVVSRITLTNATISKVNRYTPRLIPQGHGGSKNVALSTHELEEIDFVFQKITYSNIMGPTSTTDDWMSNS